MTFWFTDLEGSTRLWEEHPEAMHDALARHDEIVREGPQNCNTEQAQIALRELVGRARCSRSTR